MNKSIAEILKEVESKGSRKNKIERLKKEKNNITLKRILALCFDPKVLWLLPQGPPPKDSYKLQPKAMDLQSVLYIESRKLPLFLKGGLNMDKVKREKLFFDMLESIDPDDALLLVSIKDKKMPYKGITAKLLKEEFPDLAKGW